MSSCSLIGNESVQTVRAVSQSAHTQPVTQKLGNMVFLTPTSHSGLVEVTAPMITKRYNSTLLYLKGGIATACDTARALYAVKFAKIFW